MISRRKRSQKFRGSHTHGWGAKKKHRGAGNRGGRGMAGTGKRAGRMQSWILKKYGMAYYGKHGFNRPQQIVKDVKTINLYELPDSADINLTEMGYDKLLGAGNVSKKVKVQVKLCSSKAKEKIEKAGGQVILPEKE